MDELAALDGVGQAGLVRRGEATARELVEAAITRIEALDPQVNAVVTPMFDDALRRAGAVRGDELFPGVPFLLKDLVVECEGVRFTEGSRFLGDYRSRFDSELVVRLRRAGLVVVGKTNTPEFGMYPHCEPARFGPTRNPWDVTRSTAGSSGGSAAAVASGMVPMAHASDLGGSIRYPASCCGLFGLKPSRGRNPLGPQYGDVLNGLAVEHAVTVSVRDSAALLDATAGPDVGDPYPAPPPARPFAAEVGADPGRLRIGFTTRAPGDHTIHPDCVEALEVTCSLLADLGHDVVAAEPAAAYSDEFGNALVSVQSAAVAWVLDYWIRELGREPADDDLEPVTRTYWEFGKDVSAGEYLTAIEALQRVARSVARFLLEYDLWLTPTLGSPPHLIGDLVPDVDDAATVARLNQFVAYPGILANVTGGAAMSVPLHWSTAGLPIGSHFLGGLGDEARLLRLAAQLEAARPWRDRRPPVHA
ncbi:MAG TPA: amidase [Acidimicrobiia bacterium]|jgi:amidase